MESEISNQANGTPETTNLVVKLLGDDWIVENDSGASIGSSADRESAIGLARRAAAANNASGISVLAADGTWNNR